MNEHRAAELFREHLKLAGVNRTQLFKKSKNRQPIRVHDLRTTFVTLSLASGRTETWVMDRTGHKSSDMINKHWRQARQASELNLGPLQPLNALLVLDSGGPRSGPERDHLESDAPDANEKGSGFSAALPLRARQDGLSALRSAAPFGRVTVALSGKLHDVDLSTSRPARFELATFGSVGGNDQLATGSSALQWSGIVRVGAPDRVQRVARKAAIRRRLVASLLQETAGNGADSARENGSETEWRGLETGVRLMTVKEIAAALRVCTATVYSMIERGELEHARVSNAIRVVVRIVRGRE